MQLYLELKDFFQFMFLSTLFLIDVLLTAYTTNQHLRHISTCRHIIRFTHETLKQ